MQKKDIIIKTCDRCKTTLSRERTFKDYLPLNTDGWKTIEGFLICNQCYYHFKILFSKFMGKKL